MGFDYFQKKLWGLNNFQKIYGGEGSEFFSQKHGGEKHLWEKYGGVNFFTSFRKLHPIGYPVLKRPTPKNNLFG